MISQQGVGSHAAHMLLRAGVGRLRIIDFDQVLKALLLLVRCNQFSWFSIQQPNVYSTQFSSLFLVAIVSWNTGHWANTEILAVTFQAMSKSKQGPKSLIVKLTMKASESLSNGLSQELM